MGDLNAQYPVPKDDENVRQFEDSFRFLCDNLLAFVYSGIMTSDGDHGDNRFQVLAAFAPHLVPVMIKHRHEVADLILAGMPGKFSLFMILPKLFI